LIVETDVGGGTTDPPSAGRRRLRVRCSVPSKIYVEVRDLHLNPAVVVRHARADRAVY